MSSFGHFVTLTFCYLAISLFHHHSVILLFCHFLILPFHHFVSVFLCLSFCVCLFVFVFSGCLPDHKNWNPWLFQNLPRIFSTDIFSYKWCKKQNTFACYQYSNSFDFFSIFFLIFSNENPWLFVIVRDFCDLLLKLLTSQDFPNFLWLVKTPIMDRPFLKCII
jgi:hypothetical protein